MLVGRRKSLLHRLGENQRQHQHQFPLLPPLQHLPLPILLDLILLLPQHLQTIHLGMRLVQRPLLPLQQTFKLILAI